MKQEGEFTAALNQSLRQLTLTFTDPKDSEIYLLVSDPDGTYVLSTTIRLGPALLSITYKLSLTMKGLYEVMLRTKIENRLITKWKLESEVGI